MKLSIKSKLIAVVTMFVLLLVVVGALGLRGMKLSNEALEAMYNEELTSAIEFGKIMGLMRDNRVQLLLSLQHDERMETSKLHDHPLNTHTEKVMQNIEEINRLWAEYSKLPKSEEEQKLAEEFKASRERFVQEGLLPTRAAIIEGRYDDGVRLTLAKINPLFVSANEGLEKLLKNKQESARREFAAAESHYRSMLLAIVTGIVVASLAGATISFFIVRSLIRSTKSLADASASIAAGDLAARASVDSQDEMGEIAGSFNDMAGAFAGVIGKIKVSAEKVAAAASQLSSSAEKMATGAEEVAAQAGTVATAGEEMAATSQEIAHNCGLAAEGSQRSDSAATSGAAVVKETVNLMDRIARRVKDSAQTVDSLGTRSDQIGVIVGTIEDIADQTNLLALNAAIEAARAGEQGRGFAVVADEVRALAERTTKATKEISEMIKAIQQETKGAVAAMNEGVKDVERGTEEAAKSGVALQDILEQINSVTIQVSQIATAAEQQTATTGEISNNMQQITAVVQETARGAQESASAAQQLAGLAEELQSVVGKFRLSA
ncbi:methyl-accepting chemotaxis protein [Geobacter sp. DSM 9736]|uniref:methyl-accepting chemotaxis protein n=1 Tax=Geobacter sp. DSM 9736 TaxID=1277350 RepID=UPI000B50AE74|nr:HAMP domain-containing methyl-accepting chemotaxis protein [Geobacter sp. DSM 9736]SNB46527.1 methyl-accepting chemotaxis sensory transducer with TarH sensor [Geobacter sp. DSM 9736]